MKMAVTPLLSLPEHNSSGLNVPQNGMLFSREGKESSREMQWSVSSYSKPAWPVGREVAEAGGRRIRVENFDLLEILRINKKPKIYINENTNIHSFISCYIDEYQCAKQLTVKDLSKIRIQ